MTDKELCDLISEARKIVLPENHYDSLGQRMVMLLNWNDLPEVITASEMDRETRKPALYRTIQGCESKGITAPQLKDDLLTGSVINLGGWGGRMWGNGIYFTEDFNYSRSFAETEDALTVRAVFNGKEKIVDERELFFHIAPDFLKAHPKFAKAVNAVLLIIPPDLYAPIAMLTGYNVISGKDYGKYKVYSVLNRGVLKICA